jgi:ADP-ribose pyrophosphatase
MSEIKKWKPVESRVDRDYRVFKIETKKALSPRTNRVGEFFVIKSNDWVNVIPITPDGKLVMIRQYRHGSQEVTLEIPGGLVDDEDPGEAARRELLEETGYAGDGLRLIGSTNPNPAIFDNLCHTYLIENVKLVADKNLDVDEDIEVVLTPPDEIPALIRNGTINHALVIVAFHYYFSR